MPSFGLKDVPILSKDEESLGLTEYAVALTEFIEHCDTPMTMALQGDWGSGKTSLMNLIREDLDGQPSRGEPQYKTVWFNTWQYAQFNMADTLPVSMMSKITDELEPSGKSDAIQSVRRGLWAVTRAVTIGGAGLVGQTDNMKAAMNELERVKEDGADPASAVERLKQDIETIVQRQHENGVAKVVIFIDDLDRLVPSKAIEVLEAMKIFLDIDHCVYVIACDYLVVQQGLKDKFNASEADTHGKSFFDKIIQVPFKMPTKRYEVDNYLESLLGQLGLPFEREDIDIYRELVESSTGFNPRTMKRLFNNLQLLAILYRQRYGHATGSRRRGRPRREMTEDARRHACRVSFGILCMTEMYEPLHEHIRENMSAERIDRLCERLADGEDAEFVGLRKQIKEERVLAAQEFCKAFRSCIQLDEDKTAISDEEIEHAKNLMSMSALVSTSDKQEQDVPRAFAVQLRAELNGRYAKRIGKFRMKSGVVYLELPTVKARFHLDFARSFRFGVGSSDQPLAQDARDHLCKTMGWGKTTGATRLETGDWFYGVFETPVTSTADDAKDNFMHELFRYFDQLASEDLRRLCADIAARS